MYNETVKDLLSKESGDNLPVVEDPQKGMIVPGLKEVDVHNLEEAMA